MPTVVIVHAADDALPARALAEKLRRLGVTPVIERQPGATLRQAIEDSDAVIALWSPRSVGQGDLIDAISATRAPVLHARMQNAASPEPFAGAASIDLTGWRGEDEFPAWRQLAEDLSGTLGLAPPPAPGRAPSQFFQPGAPAAQSAAPPPRAAPAPAAAPAPQPAPPPRPAPPRAMDPPPLEPEKSGGNLVTIALITFVVVAALLGGGYFFWNSMSGSQAASAAWEELDKDDPAALRAFLEGEPGEFRDDAQDALAELDAQSYADARSADTIEAYEMFVRDFPDSPNVLAARGRIAELRALPEPLPLPTEEIDPLTGMPYPATDPDLLPPNAAQNPDVTTQPDGPAPTPLTPTPLNPPPADTGEPPPQGAPL